MALADPEGGTGGPDPMKSTYFFGCHIFKDFTKGFLCNTGPDHLKNHKATKPAVNVGPSLARSETPFKMVFCWWADEGPFMAIF